MVHSTMRIVVLGITLALVSSPLTASEPASDLDELEVFANLIEEMLTISDTVQDCDQRGAALQELVHANRERLATLGASLRSRARIGDLDSSRAKAVDARIKLLEGLSASCEPANLAVEMAHDTFSEGLEGADANVEVAVEILVEMRQVVEGAEDCEAKREAFDAYVASNTERMEVAWKGVLARLNGDSNTELRASLDALVAQTEGCKGLTEQVGNVLLNMVVEKHDH